MDNTTHATYATLEAGLFDRSFDSGRADYLKQINDSMQAAAGVRYLEIQNAFHPGNEAYKSAFDEGVAPADFVARTMEDFGLVGVGRMYSAEDARSYNMVKAAMCEFSSAEPDWNRGRDGSLFHQTDTGVAMMRPVRDRKSGQFGFGIEHFDGAALDANMSRLEVAGEVRSQNAALDLGEAVTAFKSNYDSARHFRF